jgi:hypothetical protein
MRIKNDTNGGWQCGPVVEYLLRLYETLCLIPSSANCEKWSWVVEYASFLYDIMSHLVDLLESGLILGTDGKSVNKPDRIFVELVLVGAIVT